MPRGGRGGKGMLGASFCDRLEKERRRARDKGKEKGRELL